MILGIVLTSLIPPCFSCPHSALEISAGTYFFKAAFENRDIHICPFSTLSTLSDATLTASSRFIAPAALQVMADAYFEAAYANTEVRACSFFLPTILSDGALVSSYSIRPIGLDG